MNKGVVGALCATAVFAFSAQTPAPPPKAPTAVPTKSLRHLEYAYSIDYVTSGEVHDSGFSGFGGGGGSGVETVNQSDNSQGTISVDVMGIAGDDGLIVRATQHEKQSGITTAPSTCEVYGDGRVLCSAQEGQMTDSINALFMRLGRNYYDPSIVDDKGRWDHRSDFKGVSIRTTYSMPKKADAGPSRIDEHREVRGTGSLAENTDEDTTVMYDVALSVPVSIASQVTPQSRGVAYTRRKVVITLQSDSFAKP